MYTGWSSKQQLSNYDCCPVRYSCAVVGQHLQQMKWELHVQEAPRAEAVTWKSYAFILVKLLTSGLEVEWNAFP